MQAVMPSDVNVGQQTVMAIKESAAWQEEEDEPLRSVSGEIFLLLAILIWEPAVRMLSFQPSFDSS